MDLVWAESKLRNYLAVCAEYEVALPPGTDWNSAAKAANDKAELMLSTVGRILRTLQSSDTGKLLPPSYISSDSQERVRRALGALLDYAEVEKHLAPEAPELVADQLHSTVWATAALVWPTGQYRVAVGHVAQVLSTKIKSRAKSRLSEGELMASVFSPDQPKKGASRLHLPGDPSTDTWRSRQRGLHLLAQGVYAGVRNVATHEQEDWTEHQALEYLATFSVLARWSDETELVDPPD